MFHFFDSGVFRRDQADDVELLKHGQFEGAEMCTNISWGRCGGAESVESSSIFARASKMVKISLAVPGICSLEDAVFMFFSFANISFGIGEVW